MNLETDILIVSTADGSPSARLGGSLETMHSEHGALSETRYVYQPAVELVLRHGLPPHFLSVGLGLGYQELMLAALAGGREWRCESYEARADLRAAFVAWVRGEPSALAPTYDAIARAWSDGARAELRRAQREGRWVLHGALGPESRPANASAIFFDAFSRATSPELWDEAFLRGFLAHAAAERAVFTTYAATGPLKRVLKAAGFTLEARRGFAGKRECTFALRGVCSPF